MTDHEVAAKLGLKCPRCGSVKVSVRKWNTTDNTHREHFWDGSPALLGPVIIAHEVEMLCECGTSASVKWEDRK